MNNKKQFKKQKMTVSKPIISTTITSAKQPQSVNDIKILFVGQKVSGGTAIAGEITENIISIAESNTYFGRTSHLAKIIRKAYQRVFALTGSKKPVIDAIALDDNGGGSQASKVLSALTTNADGNEVFTIQIEDKVYTYTPFAGDTPTEVGDALVALVTADLNTNTTLSNSAGTLTFTAVNAGTVGNQIYIKLSVSGGSMTIDGGSSEEGYLITGANDPSLTGLFDVVTNAQKQYTFIIYPSGYTRSTLTDFTEAQFATNDRMFGFQAVADTYGNLNTLVDGLNFKTLGLIGNVINASGVPQFYESADVITACVTCTIASLLTTGSVVGFFVTNNQSRGGTFWAGIPFHNTVLQGFQPIGSARKISNTQSTELTNSGLIVLQNNIIDTLVSLSTVKTTYKTDALGNNDFSFRELNRYLCAVLSVQYIVNNLQVKYSQYALTDEAGILPANVAITNKDDILATIKGYYLTLSDVNGVYRLLRGGETNIERFMDALEAGYTEDLATGTVNLGEILLNVISQIRGVNLDFFVNVA